MRPLDRRLRPLLAPARVPLAGAATASVLGTAAIVAQTFVFAHLVVVVVSGRTAALASSAVLLAALVATRALLGWCGDVCSAYAAASVSRGLRHRLTGALLRLPGEEMSRQRLGELTVLVTRGVSAVEPYVTRYLPALVLAVLLPPVVLVAIATQDLGSAVVVALTLPLVPVFAVLVGLTTRDRANRQWATLATLAGHFVDVVRGLPTLVVHRRATAQSRTIRRVTDRHRRATLDTLRLAFASSTVLELVATLSVALVAVLVGVRLASGSMQLEPALVVLLLAPEAYWPLRRVGAEFHAAAEGVATFEAAQRLLDGAGEDAPAPVEPPAVWSGVRVADLRVRYPGRSAAALDLTGRVLDLPAAGLVAVTGPSGSGKSTLLATLAGELAAESGTVSAPGRLVSWVPQRPWLLDASVRSNLTLARPGAGDDELWGALGHVGLRSFVAGLPGGLDAPVGEDGRLLSAGQRARLSLARAVLARRPLVLVDEPTAHLDPGSAEVAVRVLAELASYATVVVVTHDERVVAAADQEVRLAARPARVPAAAPPAPIPVTARPAGRVEDDPAESTDGSSGRRTWLLSLLLGVLAAGCGVALTVTSGWLVTRAAAHPPILFLTVAIVAVRTFGVARPLLRYVERLLGHDSALRLLAVRRAEVYDVLVPLTPGALGRRRGDVLATVVDDVDALLDERLRVRAPLVSLVGVGVAAAALAAWVLPPAGLVTASLLVGCLATGAVVRRAVGRCEADLVARRAELSDRVGDTVAGARHLQLWQATAAAVDRVDRAGAALATATRRSATWVAAGRATILLGVAGASVLLALLAGPAVAQGRVSAPWAVALLLLPLALLETLLPAPDAAAVSVRTAAARDRLAALAGTQPVVAEPVAPLPAAAPGSGIAAAGLAGGWDHPVFAGLDLQVAQGERVGVVGPSGSGKSTLAATLVRFVDPVEGSVRIGGVDARRMRLDDVHRRVGLVDDDPYVFSSSVLENVRLARPEADRSEVAAALRAVRLGPWLDELPDGLDTLVGEGRAAVSGGERARLGLARALLADQRVLVLDEPTAHLDGATAAEVTADLLGATTDRAVVWVMHDTVAREAMDRIVDLSELSQRDHGLSTGFGTLGPRDAAGGSVAWGPRPAGHRLTQSGPGGPPMRRTSTRGARA